MEAVYATANNLLSTVSMPHLPSLPHLSLLPSRYRLKPPGGGLRTKVMKLDGWLQFLMDAHLVDSQFTIQVRGGREGWQTQWGRGRKRDEAGGQELALILYGCLPSELTDWYPSKGRKRGRGGRGAKGRAGGKAGRLGDILHLLASFFP